MSGIEDKLKKYQLVQMIPLIKNSMLKKNWTRKEISQDPETPHNLPLQL